MGRRCRYRLGRRNFKRGTGGSSSSRPPAVPRPRDRNPVRTALLVTRLDEACLRREQGRRWAVRLLLIDVASAAMTTLATGFFDGQVSFSPDSESLAYVDARAQYVPDRRGAERDQPRDACDQDLRPTRRQRRPGARPRSPSHRHAGQPRRETRRRSRPARRQRLSPAHALSHDEGSLGPYPVAWSADGKRLLGGLWGLDAWTHLEAYAIDPIRGGSRLIAHRLAPAALSRDGRYVIGETGDAEKRPASLYGSNIVRVPWGGGMKRVLLRHAVAAELQRLAVFGSR